jgi:hypothetical protein
MHSFPIKSGNLNALASVPVKPQWVLHFERDRVNNDVPFPEVIKGAVGANTWRGIRGQPSRIFRPWALEAWPRFSPEFQRVQVQNDYDKWLTCLADDLAGEWSRFPGSELRYGQRMKLVNLLIKALWASPHTTMQDAERITWFLHVPLDTFILSELKKNFRSVLPVKLPGQLSMGSIKDESMYKLIQATIRGIMSQRQEPPIAFDYQHWNQNHPGFSL